MSLGSIICEEKIRLVAGYCAEVVVYHREVASLEHAMIAGSSTIYETHYKSVEAARHLSETAREELESHVRQHGC